ncbi:MAG: hypothetical protein ACOX7J_00200 [Bacillota bacterium]|jgi:hypothetical protein
MSPRTGRPKIENPKSERITVRLGIEESQILKDYCNKFKTERVEAIRRGIQKLKPEIEK